MKENKQKSTQDLVDGFGGYCSTVINRTASILAFAEDQRPGICHCMNMRAVGVVTLALTESKRLYVKVYRDFVYITYMCGNLTTPYDYAMVNGSLDLPLPKGFFLDEGTLYVTRGTPGKEEGITLTMEEAEAVIAHAVKKLKKDKPLTHVSGGNTVRPYSPGEE